MHMSNPIKPTIKTELLPIIIILIAAISSFYFYANFPEQVPIHWNAAGEVDNYGSRAIGAFLFPAIILGMYLMFLGIPYIDPKKERYSQFSRVYHVFKNLLIIFMAGIYFIASFNALGYDVSVATWIPLMVGVLFIFLGNYMSKIKPNWFMGIRTPWTLSSEEVWNKTHRLGGKVFIGGGIALMTMNFLPASFRMPLFVSAILIMVVGTIGYSYFLYNKEQKTNEKNTESTKSKD